VVRSPKGEATIHPDATRVKQCVDNSGA
jgi:hypothetical protein